MRPSPIVIAHRGIHGTGVTENTIAAFEAAGRAGAEMIELDVRRAGDGSLAILHDEAVNGVPLRSCSLDELEARTGLRPPLLSEVLDWAHGRIALDVELKEDGYIEQLEPLLSRFADGGNELIATSFLDPVLAALRTRAPALALGLLLEQTSGGFAGRARACGAGTALPEMALLDQAFMAQALGAGLEVIAWDFFAVEHASWLGDSRLRGVITDDVPGALRSRGW